MNSKRKFIAILAIFCMIASAGIISAADNDLNNKTDFFGVDSDVIMNYTDFNDLSDFKDFQNATDINSTDMYNHDANDNLTDEVADYQPGNDHVDLQNNSCDNEVHTEKTVNKILATGNPIVVALAVIALIGSSVIRKK